MNLKKYKLLGGSALLLLAVSSVVATGILYLLNILLFSSVFISAIACSGIVLGLAFLAAISKISQKKSEIEENFFKDLENASNNNNKEEVGALLKKQLFLGPSKKKISRFLEKQGEDFLKTPFLHKIILLGNQEILSWIYINLPDLNWNVKNAISQTILHIIAENDDKTLASQFLIQDKKKLKLDLSIKDNQEQTAKMITENKRGADVPYECDSISLLYKALESKCIINSGRPASERS